MSALCCKQAVTKKGRWTKGVKLKVIGFAGKRDYFKLLKFAQKFLKFIKVTLWGRCFRQWRLVISFFGWVGYSVCVCAERHCVFVYVALLLQMCVFGFLSSFFGSGGQITFWVFVTKRHTHCSHLALHGGVEAWQKAAESPTIDT